MTDTDDIVLEIETAPDRELARRISRRLIESAAILSGIVRSQCVDLRALDAERDEKKRKINNTGAATRELVSLVLAATRTMEMKHRIDAEGGAPDKLARDEARKLLDLTDAEIAEFLARRKAAQGKAPDRKLAGAEPALLAGDRA